MRNLEYPKAAERNTSVFSALHLQDHFIFKEIDIVNDCSDLLLCFQSLLVSGMPMSLSRIGLCIQRHIVSNVFIQHLQTFLLMTRFYVLTFLKLCMKRSFTSVLLLRTFCLVVFLFLTST